MDNFISIVVKNMWESSEEAILQAMELILLIRSQFLKVFGLKGRLLRDRR
jgi:hypothetical protein